MDFKPAPVTVYLNSDTASLYVQDKSVDLIPLRSPSNSGYLVSSSSVSGDDMSVDRIPRYGTWSNLDMHLCAALKSRVSASQEV